MSGRDDVGIHQPVRHERHARPSPARLFERLYARGGDMVLLAENVKRLLRSNWVPLVERPGVPLKDKSEKIMLYAPGIAAERMPTR